MLFHLILLLEHRNEHRDIERHLCSVAVAKICSLDVAAGLLWVYGLCLEMHLTLLTNMSG